MVKIIGIGVVVIIVVVGGIFLLRGDSSTGGVDIPDITLQDYEGNEVNLRELVQGRPVVLNSWAAWCPFCVKELPAFSKVQDEFGEEVLIVAINRAESLSTARTYTDDLEVAGSMVFLLDPSDSFYKAIGGFSMPETLFIDAEGVTQIHKRGPMEPAEIRQKIQSLFN